MPIVLKSGRLNLPELTGPVQGLLYVFVFMNNVKYLTRSNYERHVPVHCGIEADSFAIRNGHGEV